MIEKRTVGSGWKNKGGTVGSGWKNKGGTVGSGWKNKGDENNGFFKVSSVHLCGILQTFAKGIMWICLDNHTQVINIVFCSAK